MANLSNPCCVKGCRNTPHVKTADDKILCRKHLVIWWNMGKKI